MNKPLKIGFDLDGVLLYNPARMLRPVTKLLKHFLKREDMHATHFYYPRSPIEVFIWRAVHWSSFPIASGYDEVKSLVSRKKIEAYLITGRYQCLKPDYEFWMRRLQSDKFFQKTYYNRENLQPHLFKAQEIKKQKLDYYIEDNYDIASYIANHTQTKVIWITNPFDAHIPYQLKFPTFKKAITFIAQKVTK